MNQILMSEVKQILDEVDVRPIDNFIELGGNSFLAIQVAMNLKDKGWEIEVGQLLGNHLENVCLTHIENKTEHAK